MSEDRRSSATAESTLTVVFTCEWCGRRVELATTETGAEIGDVQAFLAQHRDCIREQVPRQRP